MFICSFFSSLFWLDTNGIVSETKDLIIEAKSGLIVLIFTFVIISFISILLSTWLAQTITDNPEPLAKVLGRYFHLDQNQNESESNLKWWRPKHILLQQVSSQENIISKIHRTDQQFLSFNESPRFYSIALPLVGLGAIILAILAFYIRVQCTDRNFAWGAIPKGAQNGSFEMPNGTKNKTSFESRVDRAPEHETAIFLEDIVRTSVSPVV